MTAAALLHRYFPGIYLSFVALLGVALGWLASMALGIWLTPPVQMDERIVAGQSETAGERSLTDYQVILDRNIFNSSAPVSAVLTANDTITPQQTTESRSSAEEQRSARTTEQNRKSYTLVGTVVGGDASLAVLREGRNTEVYGLNAELPDGAVVDRILRHSVTLKYGDGDTETLILEMDGVSAPVAAKEESPPKRSQRAQAAAEKNPYRIKEIGDNRWAIPKESAESARGNLNDLLRQARVEPYIVNGQTRGFVVRMIQPNTFLDILGIKRGDILVKINDIDLNSPEKALQIFQQLREARNISVDLLRGGEPATFKYEIN